MAQKKKQQKRKQNSGLALYQKIQKQFTKINNDLPENRKLSVQLRRKIISETLYPKFKKLPKSKIRLRDINTSIEGIVDLIPPSELCDPNFISPQLYATVAWYDIDEFIQNVMPDCIFVKVNAGEYGETKVFNTRNYEYNKSGVRDIIENVRPLAENTSALDFSGYQKLRSGKKNDGTPENYYIEFILNINAEPQGNTNVTKFALSKDDKPTQRKVRATIIEKINQLKSKKRKKVRARKTLAKNIELQKALGKIIEKKKSPAEKKKWVVHYQKSYEKLRKAMDRDFKAGLLTEAQYKAALKNLFK